MSSNLNNSTIISNTNAITNTMTDTMTNNNHSIPIDKKTLLVFVVGGISHLEIAALRYLSMDHSFPYKIIIGSTKVMNGASFLSSLQ